MIELKLMFKLQAALLIAVLVCVLGCGDARETGVAVVPPPPAAKVTLEEIAQSGSLQGKQERLREELWSAAESHLDSPDELMADYEQLISESNPAAIKAKASEMAAKL